MSSPETQRDFYKFVIHVINASIIAYSFGIVYNSGFIPFGQIQTTGDKINFIAMLFVWGVMISGWLGYTKSINDKPHSEGHLGNIRFAIDLVISFLMLYLFIITGKDYFYSNFGETFTFVLPTIFLLYVFWDYIKNKEYPTSNPDMHNILQMRVFMTVIVFLALSGQSIFFIFYESLSYHLASQFNISYSELFISDANIRYCIFIGTSSGFIALYRITKGRQYRGFD